MDKKLFELGLSKRKATLGSEYVEKNLEAADDFNEDFQKQMTEWCWGFGWGDDTINEKTSTSGVTIDGVLLKDGGGTFTGDVSANDASFNVVDIASLKVNAVQLPTKSEAGAPATTPTAGTMVFNTNDNKLYIYNGSAWRSVDTDAV